MLPDPVLVSADVEQSKAADFTLQNQGTALTYVTTTSGMVAVTANAAGVLAESGAITIPLLATCPATAGVYTSTVALTFGARAASL